MISRRTEVGDTVTAPVYVTLAGFAGLIAALVRREGGHSSVAAWRIRNVVYEGFGVTFSGFATVVLHTITQNVDLTVRLATIGMLLTSARRNSPPRQGHPLRQGVNVGTRGTRVE